MKRRMYILIRILNWLLVLLAAFVTVNLLAYAGDWQEMHCALPDHITLMLITAWVTYILGMIPLWFYKKSQVTRVQKRIGYIMAGIEIPFALAFAWLFWHYRLDGFPFGMSIPLATPLIINSIGLFIMRFLKESNGKLDICKTPRN